MFKMKQVRHEVTVVQLALQLELVVMSMARVLQSEQLVDEGQLEQ
jgi:hypothetical protein